MVLEDWGRRHNSCYEQYWILEDLGEFWSIEANCYYFSHAENGKIWEDLGGSQQNRCRGIGLAVKRFLKNQNFLFGLVYVMQEIKTKIKNSQ